MSALDDFRAEARAWLEANCPASMRTPPGSDDEDTWGGRRATFFSDDARLWFERMRDRGWTAPTWPRAYGGGGLSEAEGRVLEEELRRLGCRMALKSFGIWMLGPVLLEAGTEEQKREHLTGIARGELRWCQGYSEPGAGSDLASLGMRAVREGDHYVVSGQKIWTSHADKADWMFCLVRTDPSVPKRDGISFLLVDMASPGISVRPIRLISGNSPFCETFFDGVRVPARNLVGREGGGWAIATSLLKHERAMIARIRDARAEAEEALESIAKRVLGEARGEVADRVVRAELAQLGIDVLANKLALRRAAEEVAAGRPAGAESSMFKYCGTELGKRRREMRVRLLGLSGLGWEGEGFTPAELSATRDWLRSRASSIEGGSSEIQLNILAKRVLGLPA